MKRTKTAGFLLIFLLGIAISASSCSKKVGCEINQQAQNPMETKSKKQKTKTHLFDPKKTKKRSG